MRSSPARSYQDRQRLLHMMYVERLRVVFPSLEKTDKAQGKKSESGIYCFLELPTGRSRNHKARQKRVEKETRHPWTHVKLKRARPREPDPTYKQHNCNLFILIINTIRVSTYNIIEHNINTTIINCNHQRDCNFNINV